MARFVEYAGLWSVRAMDLPGLVVQGIVCVSGVVEWKVLSACTKESRLSCAQYVSNGPGEQVKGRQAFRRNIKHSN